MALDTADYGALAGVLIILLAVMVYNQLKARGEGGADDPRPPSNGGDDDEHTVHPYLSRFVTHEGDVVGETVSVEADTLILKQAGVFKAVAMAQAELHGDEVRLTGHIDWDHAKRDGAAWLEANRAGSDESVAGELTRSEDVQSPALEAFKRREEERAGQAEATGATDGTGPTDADSEE